MARSSTFSSSSAHAAGVLENAAAPNAAEMTPPTKARRSSTGAAARTVGLLGRCSGAKAAVPSSRMPIDKRAVVLMAAVFMADWLLVWPAVGLLGCELEARELARGQTSSIHHTDILHMYFSHMFYHDIVAEWSKAPDLGSGLSWRRFKSCRCQTFFFYLAT